MAHNADVLGGEGGPADPGGAFDHATLFDELFERFAMSPKLDHPAAVAAQQVPNVSLLGGSNAKVKLGEGSASLPLINETTSRGGGGNDGRNLAPSRFGSMWGVFAAEEDDLLAMFPTSPPQSFHIAPSRSSATAPAGFTPVEASLEVKRTRLATDQVPPVLPLALTSSSTTSRNSPSIFIDPFASPPMLAPQPTTTLPPSRTQSMQDVLNELGRRNSVDVIRSLLLHETPAGGGTSTVASLTSTALRPLLQQQPREKISSHKPSSSLPPPPPPPQPRTPPRRATHHHAGDASNTDAVVVSTVAPLRIDDILRAIDLSPLRMRPADVRRDPDAIAEYGEKEQDDVGSPQASTQHNTMKLASPMSEKDGHEQRLGIRAIRRVNVGGQRYLDTTTPVELTRPAISHGRRLMHVGTEAPFHSAVSSFVTNGSAFKRRASQSETGETTASPSLSSGSSFTSSSIGTLSSSSRATTIANLAGGRFPPSATGKVGILTFEYSDEVAARPELRRVRRANDDDGEEEDDEEEEENDDDDEEEEDEDNLLDGNDFLRLLCFTETNPADGAIRELVTISENGSCAYSTCLGKIGMLVMSSSSSSSSSFASAAAAYPLPYQPHDGEIRQLAYSERNRLLLSGGHDEKIAISALGQGSEFALISTVRVPKRCEVGSISWHPTLPAVATFTTDAGCFGLLDVRSRNIVTLYDTHRDMLHAHVALTDALYDLGYNSAEAGRGALLDLRILGETCAADADSNNGNGSVNHHHTNVNGNARYYRHASSDNRAIVMSWADETMSVIGELFTPYHDSEVVVATGLGGVSRWEFPRSVDAEGYRCRAGRITPFTTGWRRDALLRGENAEEVATPSSSSCSESEGDEMATMLMMTMTGSDRNNNKGTGDARPRRRRPDPIDDGGGVYKTSGAFIGDRFCVTDSAGYITLYDGVVSNSKS